MKFTIQVNDGPYQHQASDSAYHFTLAALHKGHQIVRVFFYHDGVLNSSHLITPPQDDRHVVARWSQLATDFAVDLVVCVAAAQRRGIVDEAEASRHGLAVANIAPGFRLGGLGQLVEAVLSGDRLITFGD
ncbi:MAG: sulfurtransferase complex subunit TusD [Pseudomonadota bacterium]